MKKHWKILLAQCVLLLVVVICFFYFKGLSDKQVYGEGRNRYVIEVHHDPEKYTIQYTIESYETNLEAVIKELQETKAFSYTEKNGELVTVNDLEAKKEKTAYWMIQVNWDKEYRKLKDVNLKDLDNIWIIYAQEQW